MSNVKCIAVSGLLYQPVRMWVVELFGCFVHCLEEGWGEVVESFVAVYRLIHTVIFSLCFANIYLFMTRFANFVRTCLLHNTSVVQNVANYSVLWAQCESPMGRNAMHCIRLTVWVTWPRPRPLFWNSSSSFGDWRRDDWHDLERHLNKGQGHSFWYQSIRLPIGCQ